jgi:hypothetical protein
MQIEPTMPKRRRVLDANACLECQANTDPSNVPVHPHCGCSVITDEIDVPGTDRETIAALARLVDLPDNLWPRPESLVSIPDLRFSDLLVYEAEHVGEHVLALILDTEGITRDVDLATIMFVSELL